MILLRIESQNHPVRIGSKIPELLHKVGQVWVVRLGREVSTIGMRAQDQGFLGSPPSTLLLCPERRAERADFICIIRRSLAFFEPWDSKAIISPIGCTSSLSLSTCRVVLPPQYDHLFLSWSSRQSSHSPRLLLSPEPLPGKEDLLRRWQASSLL